MSTSLGNDLQALIFKALNLDAQLGALLGGDRIYDFVPDNQDYPYVVIGEEDVQPYNTKTSAMFEGTTTVNVWTQNIDGTLGKEQCKAIMQQIWRVLDNRDLGLPGRVQMGFRAGRQSITTQPDNITQNGLIEFNFMFGGN